MADIFQNKINQFIGDAARPAKFEVYIFSPSGVKFKNKSQSEAAEEFSYYCYAGSFPGATAESIDFKYLGRNIPVPNVLTPNQTWTATFYNDEKHKIRKFFKDWMESYQIHNYNGSNYNDFENLQLAIYQYNYELKEKTAVCVLYGVFPKSISDIEISYESLSQVQTFQVEFQFVYWDITEVEAGLSAEAIKDAIKNTVTDTINGVLKTGQNIVNNAVDKVFNKLNSYLDTANEKMQSLYTSKES